MKKNKKIDPNDIPYMVDTAMTRVKLEWPTLESMKKYFESLAKLPPMKRFDPLRRVHERTNRRRNRRWNF